MSPPPFQAFLDAHAGEVHHFLVGMVGRDDAEDCFQETFMASLRAYPRLRPGSNLRAWVFTIARRKAIDSLRDGRRRAEPRPDPPAAAAPPAAEGDEALWRSLGALPPKQRTAVFLRYALDLPYPDVARVLESSEPAARRNVHEGLKKLKEVAR